MLTVGSYNYTQTDGNGTSMSIPNVPLDAAAFAETALVYSALIGEAPTKAEVAKITLTPQYQIRPMDERAKMILDLPAFAHRYGLLAPEVDLPSLQNGKAFETGMAGQSILIDAVVVNPNDRDGSSYKESIRDINVRFNGEQKGSLQTGEVSDQGYYHYIYLIFPAGSTNWKC